ncbi:MAG: UDP-N-acetylmuramate dehydrogenase [Rhodobacteraceae bacterium]|nr:UDP-N-acetylmuramate dehydrogenase [Paracoccaceae bacterium]
MPPYAQSTEAGCKRSGNPSASQIFRPPVQARFSAPRCRVTLRPCGCPISANQPFVAHGRAADRPCASRPAGRCARIGRRHDRSAPLRGRATAGRLLAELTWLRVGGPADWLVQPADTDDLARFLRQLPRNVPVFPLGVGSNLIVRDGGIRGVVVRLGRGFNAIAVTGQRVRAGAAALDSHVARRAAAAGVDLTFLRTIPGSLGGAVRMNAGCYGRYMADVLVAATAVTRAGEVIALSPADLAFAYRRTTLPPDTIVTEAVLEGPSADPAMLEARMADQLARRDATQPTRDRSAGSTFRNPAGHSSTGAADDTHDLKAWKLIADAGMKGARLGGAQISAKHANFLVNAGGATAAELERLGEAVRKRVSETTGHLLEWEIMRVGEPARDQQEE